jgi:phosphoribosylamine--glycine ligase
LGDPETQVVLPRVKNDFAQVIDAAVNHEKLPEIEENDCSILGRGCLQQRLSNASGT